jgi:hypothetical protein
MENAYRHPSRLAFNLFPHWNNDNASAIICIAAMKFTSQYPDDFCY